MSFSLFEREELEAIAKLKETNDRTEEFLNTERDKFNKEVNQITQDAQIPYNASNAQKIMDLQLQALTLRQYFNEQISFYLNKRIKENSKLKLATQEKLVWYAMGHSKFNVTGKLTQGQISNVVDAHTTEVERSVKLLEVHVEFFRTSSKVLSDLGYIVKNTIEYHNLLLKN
jgi:hypothetical protein